MARRYRDRPDVLGVVIGGSLARGQEWRHSDLELGLLVEQRLPGMGHFHTDSGRGVEIFQLVRSEVEPILAEVEGGDPQPVLRWPIQLWKCRIVHDPTGVLARYKASFDRHLFSPDLVRMRVENQIQSIEKSLAGIRLEAKTGHPADALVSARWVMNELILALHWVHGELPRSQNRTDQRLRQLCRRHRIPDAYETYLAVFDLNRASRMIRSVWPGVREEVLEITRAWGDATRDFFEQAVDSEFRWGQDRGILTVYRLYLPKMGEERSVLARLKARDASLNPRVVEFLGLVDVTSTHVLELAAQMEQCLGLVREQMAIAPRSG